ncbi:hypothetical protein [Nonomuraea sp. NPDC049784]|uniref:hypothetical protein n=1 Tax=Nonomuraea sp. NPDC049784 TaxID=3154361 RepID=UPI0033E9E350
MSVPLAVSLALRVCQVIVTVSVTVRGRPSHLDSLAGVSMVTVPSAARWTWEPELVADHVPGPGEIFTATVPVRSDPRFRAAGVTLA